MLELVARAVWLAAPVLGIGWLMARSLVGVALPSLMISCAIVFSFTVVSLIWHICTACRVSVTVFTLGLVAWAVFTLLLVAVPATWRARRLPRVHLPSGGLWAAAVTAIVAGYAGSYLVRALCFPVYVASDAPIYHLPFAIEWVKHGRITLVPTPFGETAATYFPANASCWYAYLMLVSGSEVLAKAGQWPFLVAGACAVHAAARLLGARHLPAVVAACAWATAPHVLFFSSVPLADLALAACVMVSVALLLDWGRFRRPAALAGSYLSLGAGMGTKLIAALFVAPLLVAGTLWLLLYSDGRVPRRLATASVCGFLGLAGCVFWYARNWLVTGNPFYPAHVQVGELVLFQGWYTTDVLRATSPYAIPVQDWRAFASIAVRTMTPALAPLYVLSLLWGLLVRGRGTFTLCCVVWGHWLLYWCVNPYQTQERFLLSTLAIMAAVLARFMTVLPPLLWWAGLAVVVQPLFPQPDFWRLVGQPGRILFDEFPALVRLPWSYSTVARGVAAALIMAGATGLLALVRRRPGLWRAAIALIVGAIAVCGSYRAIAYCFAVPAELRFYPTWELTDGWLALENTSPRTGTCVAYAGTNLRYYLYCLGLRNSVVYANVEGGPNDLMHDFHRRAIEAGRGLASTSRPRWGREKPNYEQWWANIRALKAQFLFVTTVNVRGGTFNIADIEGFPIERVWADRHSESFRLVASGRLYRLYRVLADPEPGAALHKGGNVKDYVRSELSGDGVTPR